MNFRLVALSYRDSIEFQELIRKVQLHIAIIVDSGLFVFTHSISTTLNQLTGTFYGQ